MHALKLVLRNALRHRLRTALTVLGLVVAVLAFGLLQTVIDAWYSGARAASNGRLVTRNAISLVFSLPLSYEARIRGVDGVSAVARSNWFGGVYQDPKKFFAQFAVSDNYLELYPEFVLSEAERRDWLRDRKGCLVGRQLADLYGFKVGDVLPLRGTIYPRHVGIRRARHLRGSRRHEDHAASPVPLGLPERVGAQDGAAARGPGRRLHRGYRESR